MKLLFYKRYFKTDLLPAINYFIQYSSYKLRSYNSVHQSKRQGQKTKRAKNNVYYY